MIGVIGLIGVDPTTFGCGAIRRVKGVDLSDLRLWS
jgi:hypothetical protein